MTASPTPTFLIRLLSLVALGLLTSAVIVGVTSGPGFQPLRDRVLRILGGMPADAGAAEAAPPGGRTCLAAASSPTPPYLSRPLRRMAQLRSSGLKSRLATK